MYSSVVFLECLLLHYSFVLAFLTFLLCALCYIFFVYFVISPFSFLRMYVLSLVVSFCISEAYFPRSLSGFIFFLLSPSVQHTSPVAPQHHDHLECPHHGILVTSLGGFPVFICEEQTLVQFPKHVCFIKCLKLSALLLM